MDVTYIPPDRQGLLLLYSLIVGFISGLLCGLLRIPSGVLKSIFIKRKIFCIIIGALFDIITSIVNIIVIIVFIYAANSGVIRYFLLLSALLGIILYNISFGRLIDKLSVALASAIRIIAEAIKKSVRKLTYPLRRLTESRFLMRYTKTTILSAHRR